MIVCFLYKLLSIVSRVWSGSRYIFSDFGVDQSGVLIGYNPWLHKREVVIPDYVQTIPKGFFNDLEITHLTIPLGVYVIDDEAFSGCTSIRCLKIGEACVIGSGAFAGCSGIKHLKIGNACVIGSGAFAGCLGLVSVEIGPNAILKSDAFQGCLGLEKVSLGEEATLGGGSFKRCRRLMDVKIGEGCIVEKKAFEGCMALDSVTIGKDPEVLDDAFEGCKNLGDINLDADIQIIRTVNEKNGALQVAILGDISLNNISSLAFAQTSLAHTYCVPLVMSWRDYVNKEAFIAGFKSSQIFQSLAQKFLGPIGFYLVFWKTGASLNKYFKTLSDRDKLRVSMFCRGMGVLRAQGIEVPLEIIERILFKERIETRFLYRDHTSLEVEEVGSCRAVLQI